MRTSRIAILASLALSLALCAAADAQVANVGGPTTAPANVIVPVLPQQEGALESTPIRRASRAGANATTAPAARNPNSLSTGLDWKRVGYSLAIVVGLILVMRWGSRFFLPGGRGFNSSRAVKVLTRNVISPKQQLLVIQVGRRVVVVGDSGQQMNPLCEITDPDEVAELVGRIREDAREPVGKAFSTLFSRAGSSYEPPAPAAAPMYGAGAPAVDAGGRGEQVDVGLEDPALAGTRQELTGLMEKVRLLSRQFPRA